MKVLCGRQRRRTDAHGSLLQGRAAGRAGPGVGFPGAACLPVWEEDVLWMEHLINFQFGNCIHINAPSITRVGGRRQKNKEFFMEKVKQP